MNDLIFWLADHIPVWRPFAIALLSGLVLACMWYGMASLGRG